LGKLPWHAFAPDHDIARHNQSGGHDHNRDYPALRADVLQALQRQNSGNWMMVRKELVEMIQDEV
jgi:hypothetical protein